MSIICLSDAATLHHADCRDALAGMADNSVDSVVTDPPYHLTTDKKGGTGAASLNLNSPAGRSRISTGFMGKAWDGGDIAFQPALWAEVLRVLKPGGHVAAFGSSRGYHRMACAIEDAGFDIRDSLMWVYGTGFPKSQNVSKFIDAALGAKGETIATGAAVKRMIPGADQNADGWIKDDGREFVPHDYSPGSDVAREFDGWGTALKPAFEPIVLARKPLSEGTVAANVIKWRTGALNIGQSRIPSSAADQAYMMERVGGFNNTRSIGGDGILGGGETMDRTAFDPTKGRWPANVVHDGSDEVVGAFPYTKSNPGTLQTTAKQGANVAIAAERQKGTVLSTGDSGSAARFFYSAKASKQDRNGSKHPTVKPISLMEWLCTLITPPGGTILDPFGGSGTTAVAATNRGFNVILCEREAEYVRDIRARFAAPRLHLTPFLAHASLAGAAAALQSRLQA